MAFIKKTEYEQALNDSDLTYSEKTMHKYHMDLLDTIAYRLKLILDKK